MKKTILTMILVLALAMTASAQIKPKAYAGAGLGLPMSGELKDFWKMGLNFGGSFGIQINPMFEISARFHYNSFPVDESEFKNFFIDILEDEIGLPIPPELVDAIGIDGPTVKLMEIGVDVRFFIPVGADGASFKPFLVAGAGSTSRSVGDVTLSFQGQSMTAPGEEIVTKESGGSFCFGGGFNYMFSPTTGMYIEGRYATLSVKPENYAWFQVRGGLVFEFGG